MDTYSTLMELRDLEEAASALYKKYSKMFQEDPDASALFASLSAEESDHRDMIGALGASYKKDPSSFGELDVDLLEVENALVEVAKAMKQDAKETVEEAVKFALRLELKMSEQYNIFAVAESNIKYKRLMQMTLESEEHFGKLLKFAWARGYEAGKSYPSPAHEKEAGLPRNDTK